MTTELRLLVVWAAGALGIFAIKARVALMRLRLWQAHYEHPGRRPSLPLVGFTWVSPFERSQYRVVESNPPALLYGGSTVLLKDLRTRRQFSVNCKQWDHLMRSERLTPKPVREQ